jgi:hypothetical protein
MKMNLKGLVDKLWNKNIETHIETELHSYHVTELYRKISVEFDNW